MWYFATDSSMQSTAYLGPRLAIVAGLAKSDELPDSQPHESVLPIWCCTAWGGNAHLRGIMHDALTVNYVAHNGAVPMLQCLLPISACKYAVWMKNLA